MCECMGGMGEAKQTGSVCATPSVSICKQECTHREQTSADPDDPDFGLWTPGSEA